MEAVQFHSNTQSHWFSGSTVFFPSRGLAVCIPVMHKLTMEPVSPVSNVSLHWWPRDDWSLASSSVPSMGSFTRLCANNVKKPAAITHNAFPGSIPLLAGPPPPRNLAPVKLLGVALWRPCNFTLTHSLTGPVGQPFSSHLGGQQFAQTHNGTRFPLLALSRYKIVIRAGGVQPSVSLYLQLNFFNNVKIIGRKFY